MTKRKAKEPEILSDALMTVQDRNCFHCWIKAAADAYLRHHSGGAWSFSECGSEDNARKGVGGIAKVLAEFVCDNVIARDREGALEDASRWSREYLAGAEKVAAGKLS